MSWPPMDSADAAEMREREAAQDETPAHDPDCVDGWLGEDDHDRLRPCPLCRPHLVTLPDGRVVHYRTLQRRIREDTPDHTTAAVLEQIDARARRLNDRSTP